MLLHWPIYVLTHHVQLQVNEDPTTRIINDLRGEVLRLREQLMLSQGGSSSGVDTSSRMNADVKNSLLQAEEALRNYARQWEAKQQSMYSVKSKLLKKRFAAYGVGDLQESEIEMTPYLMSLSNDPLLHMAVKVYIPSGGALRVGRPAIFEASEEEAAAAPADLQLEGLGIESSHCVIAHALDTHIVTLTNEPSAVTYVNGKPVDGVQQLFHGDRVVLGLCSHLFSFCDPRTTPDEGGGTALPTHQQALREILLGRVETDAERRERLGTLVRPPPCFRNLQAH
jgi:hypothetical protein